MAPGERLTPLLRLHATCVALGDRAALLLAPSGGGKSDLALRFLAVAEDACLVADDQVEVHLADGLIAAPPTALARRIEVRGVGVCTLDARHGRPTPLALVVRLVAAVEVPRLPPADPLPFMLLGRDLPSYALAPFEPSAPLKLRLLLADSHLT